MGIWIPWPYFPIPLPSYPIFLVSLEPMSLVCFSKSPKVSWERILEGDFTMLSSFMVLSLIVVMKGTCLVSWTNDSTSFKASSFTTKSWYNWAMNLVNLSSCQLSSSMNFSPNYKSCNLLNSNSSLIVVKESWCLESSFSISSALYLQYWLSSSFFLLKSLNSSSFSLFKDFPMVATSRYLMNLLLYHVIYKRYAYGMFVSSTWMFL